MTEAEIAKEIASLERLFQQELKTGAFSFELKERISLLQEEERSLLEEKLPLYRRASLNQRDIQGELSLVLSHETKLSESNLDEKEKEECSSLLSLEENDELIFPAGEGETVSLDEKKAIFKKGGRRECVFRFPEEAYFACFNAVSGFVFASDGTVYLLENDFDWQLRDEPILKDCFVEKAIMEDEGRALILNDGGDIYSLMYPRISSVDDWLKEPPLHE